MRKKSLVGYVAPKWVMMFIKPPRTDVGFLEIPDITKTRYTDEEIKVRITIEELSPKRKE
jgi:hypothetical protein